MEITVTGVEIGETKITVSTANGLTKECLVKVIPDIIPITGFKLEPKELELTVGDTYILNATVTPEDATDKTVTWVSMDENLATVSPEGEVTALAPGVVEIHASASDGTTEICVITINPGVVKVTELTLTNYHLTLRVGKSTTLAAIISPLDATNKTVAWRVEDNSIANYTGTGLEITVTGVEVGETKIKALSADGPSAECVITVIPDVIPVEALTLEPTELVLKVGETSELTATITPEDATDKVITWVSGDETKATVSETGVVTAIAPGEVLIHASASNGETKTCTVTILPVEVPVVEVTGITLTNATLLMREGRTATLGAILTPVDAEDKTVTWESDNEDLVIVEGEGQEIVVKAIRRGVAIITATTANGLQATCQVTVVPDEILPTGLNLSPTELEIGIGETAKLTATVTPEDATDPTVTWLSGDENIATVTNTGDVTGITAGSTLIYASTSNGITETCRVTVLPGEIEVTGITLTNTQLVLVEGNTSSITAIIAPADATDKSVVWTLDNNEIVSLDIDGADVTVNALLQGNAVVTATTANGLTAICEITVLPNFISATDLSVIPSELELTVGETRNLTAILTPDNASDKTLTWRSSDEKVATVDYEGLVTATGVGEALIYVSSSNGLTATCKVKVNPGFIEVESVTLTNYELLMRVGRTADLIAIVSPANATDPRVIWTASNPDIASVDNAGLVTAVNPGVSFITATTSNGLQALCRVTVVPDITEVASISVNPDHLELYAGERKMLTATVLPADATDPSVTWRSSDWAVATVDINGMVLATGSGTATIYVSSSNGLTAYCTVNVKGRPLTPRQLLRKGTGTTSTFVIMMDLPDGELAVQGYNFVTGYTDASGEKNIIADSPLRYSHTTPEIYNDDTNDFWTFAYLVDENNEIVMSDVRYLDGHLEVCVDPSEYGFTSKGDFVSESDDWITVTPDMLHITAACSEDMLISIHTMTGSKVYQRAYSGGKSVKDTIELSDFVPGIYAISVCCDGKTQSKRFIVR